MASESPMPPVNGTYGAPHYNAAELPAHNPSGAPNGAGISAAVPSASVTAPAENQESGPSKDEVGWYFVEQYYTTLSKNPDKLPLFYNKKSQLVFGDEADRAPVSVGQKAIGERIKEIGVEDCKVRVTNVDSQESHDKSIVIQVIGEMSNRNEPHRKYVQTFVLAKQQNGYYVLNDIFRYIAEEDEEDVGEDEEEEEEEAVDAPAEPVSLPAPAPTASDLKTLSSSDNLVEQAQSVEVVDQKLERSVGSEPTAVAAANGASVVSTDAEVEATPSEPVTESTAQDSGEAAAPVALEPEVPKDPEPTRAPPSPQPEESELATAKEPAASNKPSVPKTWASMFSAGTKVATPVVPAVPSPAAAQPKKAPAAVSQPTAQQEPSPTPPVEDAPLPSPGGWQTAGQEHSRKQSRVQSGSISANTSRDGVIKAYIKNVTEKVDATALKTALAKYGKLEYFDISRQKNCAFVEFADNAGFAAAVAANPHNIRGEDVYVEERQIRPQNTYGGFNNRGSMRGRGGMDARNASPGGRGGFGKDGARGGYQPRGGRGGSISRGRGMPQTA